ncbi:hypothetical protein B7463_g3683, partial [Scytalidium lignicola]
MVLEGRKFCFDAKHHQGRGEKCVNPSTVDHVRKGSDAAAHRRRKPKGRLAARNFGWAVANGYQAVSPDLPTATRQKAALPSQARARAATLQLDPKSELITGCGKRPTSDHFSDDRANPGPPMAQNAVLGEDKYPTVRTYCNYGAWPPLLQYTVYLNGVMLQYYSLQYQHLGQKESSSSPLCSASRVGLNLALDWGDV